MIYPFFLLIHLYWYAIPMELKSVQPLAAPTGMLYYLDYNYPSYTLYNDGTIILKTK